MSGLVFARQGKPERFGPLSMYQFRIRQLLLFFWSLQNKRGVFLDLVDAKAAIRDQTQVDGRERGDTNFVQPHAHVRANQELGAFHIGLYERYPQMLFLRGGFVALEGRHDETLLDSNLKRQTLPPHIIRIFRAGIPVHEASA